MWHLDLSWVIKNYDEMIQMDTYPTSLHSPSERHNKQAGKNMLWWMCRQHWQSISPKVYWPLILLARLVRNEPDSHREMKYSPN